MSFKVLIEGQVIAMHNALISSHPGGQPGDRGGHGVDFPTLFVNFKPGIEVFDCFYTFVAESLGQDPQDL